MRLDLGSLDGQVRRHGASQVDILDEFELLLQTAHYDIEEKQQMAGPFQ